MYGPLLCQHLCAMHLNFVRSYRDFWVSCPLIMPIKWFSPIMFTMANMLTSSNNIKSYNIPAPCKISVLTNTCTVWNRKVKSIFKTYRHCRKLFTRRFHFFPCIFFKLNFCVIVGDNVIMSINIFIWNLIYTIFRRSAAHNGTKLS